MLLSPHFTLAELTVTNTGLANTPKSEVLDRLFLTADRLEKVREILDNKPVLISSAYRSSAVNKKVGGVSNSDHMSGYCVDFTCPSFGTPYEICKELLLAKIKFDQLIHERRRWVHISFAPSMRRQMLTLPVKGSKYLSGLHV